MKYQETQYLNWLQHIYQNGEDRSDRTGVGTRSIFGEVNMRFDLLQGMKRVVPLLNTKDVHFHSIKHELLWMLSGSSDIAYLKANGVRIWDEWVVKGTEKWELIPLPDRIASLDQDMAKEYWLTQDEWEAKGITEDARRELSVAWLDLRSVGTVRLIGGDLGPVYGKQWRQWEDTRLIREDQWQEMRGRGFKIFTDQIGDRYVITRTIDQLERLESRMKSNPECRRLILSAWNVAKLDEMALQPCHVLAQFYVRQTTEGCVLDCKLYQRSGDFLLGIPFNITFYALLTHMLAYTHGFKPGRLYHTVGDAHIYSNHFEQVATQLGRRIESDFPEVQFVNAEKHHSVADYVGENILLKGYSPQAAIKAKVAV